MFVLCILPSVCNPALWLLYTNKVVLNMTWVTLS